MTYKPIVAPINQLNSFSNKLNSLIKEFYKTPFKNKFIVVSINSNSHINEFQKDSQIKSYIKSFGVPSEQIFIQTIFNPELKGQVEFHISSSKITTIATYNGFNSPIEISLFSDDKPISPPTLSYKSWFLENYYSYFKTTNGRYCKHRTGTVPHGQISAAYFTNLDYPKAFNDLLFEFSKLEEKTAYEDEEQYNIWYYGNGVETGIPPSANAGGAPPARYGTNEKNLRRNLNQAIDNAQNLSFQEKTDLKKSTQYIIDETTDYARTVGRKRLYYEIPSYWEKRGFGHWVYRNTKRTRRKGFYDSSTWDNEQ